MNKLLRIFKHRWMDRSDTLRAVPDDMAGRIRLEQLSSILRLTPIMMGANIIIAALAKDKLLGAHPPATGGQMASTSLSTSARASRLAGGMK